MAALLLLARVSRASTTIVFAPGLDGLKSMLQAQEYLSSSACVHCAFASLSSGAGFSSDKSATTDSGSKSPEAMPTVMSTGLMMLEKVSKEIPFLVIANESLRIEGPEVSTAKFTNAAGETCPNLSTAFARIEFFPSFRDLASMVMLDCTLQSSLVISSLTLNELSPDAKSILFRPTHLSSHEGSLHAESAAS